MESYLEGKFYFSTNQGAAFLTFNALSILSTDHLKNLLNSDQYTSRLVTDYLPINDGSFIK